MGRRLKISNKVIVAIAIILMAIVVVCGWFYSKEIKDLKAGLTIAVGDEEIVSYSIEDVVGMDSNTVYKEIISSNSKDEKGRYRGVMVDELLSSVGIEKDEIKTVIFISEDGYSSAATPKEIVDIMIAYEKDGIPLGDFKKGGSGPLRCIMLEDMYGTRSIKNIVKIRCIQIDDAGRLEK